MWIQDVLEINTNKARFEMDMYVSETWLDPKLKYSQLNPCKGNISFQVSEVLKKIWTPDSVFVNSLKVEIHSSPSPNHFLLIYENGLRLLAKN